MTFHCREDELRKMNRRYNDGNWECVIIYGRRRVGKTALINEFCKNKATIYFSALNSSAQENLRALSKAIHQYTHPDAQTYPEYASFEDALEEITRSERKELYSSLMSILTLRKPSHLFHHACST